MYFLDKNQELDIPSLRVEDDDEDEPSSPTASGARVRAQSLVQFLSLYNWPNFLI